MSNNFALLVLESPWWMPKENPKRASCLPFLQGIEKLHDGFNVYYATFYDTPSFEAALSQDLVRTSEKRQILYIAAHGQRGAIADGRASTILRKANEHGRRIGGVIISSCHVAYSEANLIEIVVDKISWVFGYTCSINWLGSTLLDAAIVEALVGTTREDDADKDELLETFSEALRRFNPDAPFGSQGQLLRNCIRLIQRPKFKQYPIDLTDELIQQAWGFSK